MDYRTYVVIDRYGDDSLYFREIRVGEFSLVGTTSDGKAVHVNSFELKRMYMQRVDPRKIDGTTGLEIESKGHSVAKAIEKHTKAGRRG